MWLIMRNYALSTKVVPIARDRKKELASPLGAAEMELHRSSAGELG